MHSLVERALITAACIGLAAVAGCDAAGPQGGGESKQEARNVDKQMDKVLDDFKNN